MNENSNLSFTFPILLPLMLQAISNHKLGVRMEMRVKSKINLILFTAPFLLSTPSLMIRLGDEERRLMHLVPAPAVRLM